MIDYKTHQVSDSTIVVEVSGNLDESTRSYFFKCIEDLLDAGTQYIIIECHRLGHLNSASLASLLSARKKATKNGGRIYLTHLSSSLVEVFEITKLGRLLSVYPTTELALEHIGVDPNFA